MPRPEILPTTTTSETRDDRRHRFGRATRVAAFILAGAALSTGAADPACGASGPDVAKKFSCNSEYDTKLLYFSASYSGGNEAIVVDDISTKFHIEANDAHGIRTAVDATVDHTFAYTRGAFDKALSSKDEAPIQIGQGAAILQDTIVWNSGPYAGQSLLCQTNNVRL